MIEWILAAVMVSADVCSDLMLSRGMLPSGQSLDTVIAPETFAAVAKRAAALGLPIERQDAERSRHRP